jgi:tRNA A58 N-methylase Trm61
MSLSYDVFTTAFLSKITEYDLLTLDDNSRHEVVDGYMHKSLNNGTFKKVCKYNFSAIKDDDNRVFDIEIPDDILDEIVDIVSEGMVTYWLKPYVNKQEILENVLNTKDFTTYSPAELLLRVGNSYKDTHKQYMNMIREYSYNHGDLTDLHL